MAVYILGLLSAFLVGSFILALYSIHEQYIGALACWTVCITPIGAGLDLVLKATVDKSKAENTSGEGHGIRYTQLVNEIEGGEPTI